MKKKRLLALIIFISASFNLTAQNLDDLQFGSDSTFEAITWNIEWFPKDGQTTVDYVIQIIESIDADVFAIQEISDTIIFKQMLDSLDNYTGYFQSSWFAGLAYIYKTNTVEINDIYEIYTTSPYWSPFPRSPMVMDLTFMGENYIIINNHFKCCGDEILDLSDPGDEETRRFIASNLIKEYVDNHFSDKRVMVLGDLNDILTDDQANNVFQSFIDDPVNYVFADMDIAMNSDLGWSYPTWPSHIDHILITNELFDDFAHDSSIIATIKIDEYLAGGWWEYDSSVSDHRPVAIKILPGLSLGGNELISSQTILSNYPNPFKNETNIIFSSLHEITELEIYNLRGQKVYSSFISEKQSKVSWDAKSLPHGIYHCTLLSNKRIIAIRKIALVK